MVKYWAELNTDEFAAMGNTVAVLPLAALEQHGPHLPLAVDSYIVNGVIEHAMLDPDTTPALVLPTQILGHSPEHSNFAGTISLNASTMLALLCDCAASIAKCGIKKLLFFNAHGGNTGIMDAAGREIRLKHGIQVFSASWQQLIPAETLQNSVSSTELRYGAHAGQIETSAMLYLNANLVKMELAEDFASWAQQRDAQFKMLGQGRSKMSWMAEDYNPKGATGNAKAASKAQGEILIRASASGLVSLLRELAELR